MAAFDPEKITYFAQTDARGQRVKFGIRAKDRQRHMYVIGKTGMGKSTLLENMAAQDILNGEGMAFIDPHGSAIEVLLEYVPEHRLDDVVYFAPFDMDNPISFNVMEDVGPDKRHLVVSGLMSTFKKIWVDAWSARMEYILTNALLALIEYPDTTLLSVNRMLADKAYRDKVVDHIKDPAVKAYWVDEFANYTERFAAEALPAIQNKIGQFTGNPLIRNIIGQPHSSFDIRKLMDEKKILLVNLSKGLVGETNADLLGSMLTTRIYLGAMSRADLPPAQMKQMPNFYFYVDEFQSFANATFANILSEARKYHLNLIIAHQYVEQMEEDVRNAVFGNVGTTVAFRVGPFDAEVLERIFEPKFEANDLVNLGKYQIYLSLMIDGMGSAPFSATTLPPVETPVVSYRDMVIARSRENFTKPRGEVEQMVTALHTPEERADASAKGEGGNKGGFKKPAFGAKVGQSNGNGNGKKERPKPNFENTILEKLRAQQTEDKTLDTAKPKEKEAEEVASVKESAQKNETLESKRTEAKEQLATAIEQNNESTSESKKNNEEKVLTPERVTVAPNTNAPDLAQLRSVLARISQADREATQKNSTGNTNNKKKRRERNKRREDRPKQPMVSEKKDDRSTDLKTALSAAIGNKRPEEKNTELSPVAQSNQTKPQEVSKENISRDEITPKELERMMRVNSTEKPPV